MKNAATQPVKFPDFVVSRTGDGAGRRGSTRWAKTVATGDAPFRLYSRE
jgi:hypothetical protein